MFKTTIDRNPKIASSFWGGNYITKHTNNTESAYVLASHKRAIANFVRIVTGESYPVQFHTGESSYTDGQSVTIGANITEPADFDVAVGLALHEASHCACSDFSILRDLQGVILSIIGSEEYGKLLKCSVNRVSNMLPTIKNLCNWVEDRRIDEWSYSRAPGYRPYYQSLYNKYFWSDDVTRGLKSDWGRDETLDSYMFRIINLHNSATDLDALKKLREISEVVDLDNISRLKSTKDALKVAIDIYKLIIEALDEVATSNDTTKSDTGDAGNGEPDSSETNMGDAGNGEPDSSETNMGDTESGDTDDTESGDSDDSDTKADTGDRDTKADTGDTKPDSSKKLPKLSKSAQKRLEKDIKRQAKILDGDYTYIKKKLDSSDQKNVSIIETTGSEFKTVGNSINDSKIDKIKCIVVKNCTMDYVNSNVFPFKSKYGRSVDYNTERIIQDGIRLGKRMIGKLQTRSEERNTLYNRQRSGKIDKRMISSLGYGNDSVFYVNEIDKYENANIHISIDASLSMNMPSIKWENTMILAVAIATAVDQMPNMDIQISFRGVIDGGDDKYPYLLIAYDSRVDKFAKIRKIFPHIYPRGTTPEGLAFESIIDDMVQSSGNMKSYFLNLSDGEPYFSNKTIHYSQHNAPKHIRSLINKMNSMGIKVLSYFISDDVNEDTNEKKVFSDSYGPAASFIDSRNVTQIVKTLNGLFMAKD